MKLSEFIDEAEEMFAEREVQEINDREKGTLYWITNAFQRDRGFRQGVCLFTSLYALIHVDEVSPVDKAKISLLFLTMTDLEENISQKVRK